MVLNKIFRTTKALRCSIKKLVPKNFTKYSGKHQCWSLLKRLTSLKDSLAQAVS